MHGKQEARYKKILHDVSVERDEREVEQEEDDLKFKSPEESSESAKKNLRR
jgi:hypothetical protein